MIRSLTGLVQLAQPPVYIIETGGVGYEVLSLTLSEAAGARVTASIYTVVKEDSLTLYGFRDERERGLFAMLLSVTGVGPKSALQIIGQLGADEIATALATADPAPFQKVKGIGKKVAERLVLDLAGSINHQELTPSGSLEIASALEGLGFARREYQSLLKELPAGTLDEQLAWALGKLAR